MPVDDDQSVGRWISSQWVGSSVESGRWVGGSVVGGFNKTHIYQTT